MIDRYTLPFYRELWSDSSKYDTWFAIELAACAAMEEAGIVPGGTTVAIKARSVAIDPAEIARLEGETRHDFVAFLKHVEEQLGANGRWIHYGMTSSDVVDTALALTLVRAIDDLAGRCQGLISAFGARAKEHVHTLMVARTHGVHAQPTTLGIVLAGHVAELKRGLTGLRCVREVVAVGKLAGAVGTYAHFPPEVEAAALQSLGLVPEPVSTQVVARDRHARFFCVLAVLAAAIERFATNLRHWQRTEIGEVLEPFGSGQRGSSAMPHKRNPVLSENLTGLARLVRAAVVPALENVVLWHERDLSHSSVERVLAADASSVLAFMLERATTIVDGLVVSPERMLENLSRCGELIYSEHVVLALVRKGLSRDVAHEIVQQHAMACVLGHRGLLNALRGDERVASRMSESELGLCFSAEQAVRFAEQIVNRAIDE